MTAMNSTNLPSHDVAVLWEADSEDGDPDSRRLSDWAQQVLNHQQATACELAIKVVDSGESQTLNQTYRGIDSPTNVLSFPLDSFSHSEPNAENPTLLLLGDIALCASVVRRQAQEQHKSVESHFAHMVVHGVLHLLGFDHQADDEAEEMEQLEREILDNLGFDDPYKER